MCTSENPTTQIRRSQGPGVQNCAIDYLWIEKDFDLIVPLESRDFESEISQHPCYKLQTRHEDIQGFKHLMPSRYFDANSN